MADEPAQPVELERPRRGQTRRRYWPWMLCAVLVLALVAVPAWRFYWHEQYVKELSRIAPGSYASYHELPPESALNRLPTYWQRVVSRIRTVEMMSHQKWAITPTEMSHLGQIIRYRQLGGLDRLRMNGRYDEETFQALHEFRDLRLLGLKTSTLPFDFPRFLQQFPRLEVLELQWFEQPPDSGSTEYTRKVVSTIWGHPGLRELSLSAWGNVFFREISEDQLRNMRRLYHLRIRTLLEPEFVRQCRHLPALEVLDLRGCNPPPQYRYSRKWSTEMRTAIRELKQQRPQITVHF